MRRWFLFLIAILIGVGGVLLFSWYAKPVALVETSPDLMRIDYKADYVLMVAEVFHAEGSLENAKDQLTFFGKDPALEMIDLAIKFAEQHGYKQTDLALMWSLRDAFRSSPLGQNP